MEIGDCFRAFVGGFCRILRNCFGVGKRCGQYLFVDVSQLLTQTLKPFLFTDRGAKGVCIVASEHEVRNLEQDRDRKIEEIRQLQEANFDKRVDTFVRNRIASRNSPQPTPYGQRPNPVLSQSEIDRIRNEAEVKCRYDDNRYVAQVRDEYDTKIKDAQEEHSFSPEHNQKDAGKGEWQNADPHRHFKSARKEITERNETGSQGNEKDTTLEHDEPSIKR